jgi:predicted amidophosphoribosyltransferase
MRIPGPWDDGFALDFHTVGSALLGHDDAGHPVFDTRRTELGEALYRLKYRGAWLVVPAIADVAAAFVRSCGQSLDVVVPAVPTRDRPRQPLFDVAEHSASASAFQSTRRASGRLGRHRSSRTSTGTTSASPSWRERTCSKATPCAVGGSSSSMTWCAPALH